MNDHIARLRAFKDMHERYSGFARPELLDALALLADYDALAAERDKLLKELIEAKGASSTLRWFRQMPSGEWVIFAGPGGHTDDEAAEVAKLRAERDRLAKRLAEEERNHEQTLIERDRYAEAISAAHVAAGGDGEWVAKIPPEDLPHSGDLAADVPEMVRALAAECDRLAAELAEARQEIFYLRQYGNSITIGMAEEALHNARTEGASANGSVARCPECGGTGVSGYHDHGWASFGDSAMEPLRCEKCDGFGTTSSESGRRDG